MGTDMGFRGQQIEDYGSKKATLLSLFGPELKTVVWSVKLVLCMKLLCKSVRGCEIPSGRK